MIAYDLSCKSGHEFEAWFQNAKSFERQRKKGLIECPRCGSAKVQMLYRARALRKKSPEPGGSPGMALAARVETFLKENFEDVGRRFAEEAREIHYGEGEPRNIRGETTAQEETALREEGIAFLKIALPKAQH